MSYAELINEFVESGLSDPYALASAEQNFRERLIRDQRSGSFNDLKSCVKRLRSHRLHNVLEHVSEQIELTSYRPAWLLALHAQALIERGAYVPALGLLKEARISAKSDGDAKIEADTWGQEGRIYKDLFFLGRSTIPPLPLQSQQSLLQNALDAYNWVYQRAPGGPDSHFTGVNVLALCESASQLGFSLNKAPNATVVATEILKEITTRLQVAEQSAGVEAPTHWDLASAAEAAAYLQQWDLAQEMLAEYLLAAAQEDDPFAIASTLRQFEKVWQRSSGDDPAGKMVDAMRLALAAFDGTEVTLTSEQIRELSDTKDHEGLSEAGEAAGRFLEKVFDERHSYINIKRMADIMDRSRAVGRVHMQTERTSNQSIGTGFLLLGERVHEALTGKLLFLTNAHVVSNNSKSPAQPGEAHVSFEHLTNHIPQALVKMLWSSEVDEHDCSIFEIEGDDSKFDELRDVAKVMEIAKGLPKLFETVDKQKKDGTIETVTRPRRVYVIGHPLGGELAVSLSDNDLLDYQKPYYQDPGIEPRLIHYRAPTQQGSSGSPVFNSRDLKLFGLHHAGGKLDKLNGKTGRYNTNEGLWLRTLLNAFIMDLERKAALTTS